MVTDRLYVVKASRRVSGRDDTHYVKWAVIASSEEEARSKVDKWIKAETADAGNEEKTNEIAKVMGFRVKYHVYKRIQEFSGIADIHSVDI